MRIVIIGIGKIGITLAEYLSGEGHNVTVVDTDRKVVERAVETLDVMGITGNGVNYTTQKEAGVNNADLMIAATSSDEINMLCCLVAKKVGVGNTIARIRDPEYSRQFLFMLDEMGLDMVVNPEYEAAAEISRLLKFPSAIKIDTFAKGRVELAEYKMAGGNPFAGQSIADIRKKYDIKILICAVRRGEEVYIPGGSFVLNEGDHIYFVAQHSAVTSLFKLMGVYRQRVKNVMVIGGGRIGYYLSQMLLDSGIPVKLIEHDEERCLELSELLPRAKIICGEGTDKALLVEENIEGAGACVAVTGTDEENIIISMYAKKYNVGKIITKISKTSVADMVYVVGLESVISPRTITANHIISYVRALQNPDSGVQTLYNLVEDKVEALEFYVDGDDDFTDTPLFELKLKPNLLISCIIRENKIIFPGGGDMIKRGDNVIIVTTNKKLRSLGDILR